MPIKSNQLKKERKKIITDIIFENIIPSINFNNDLYWSIDSLTAEIRKHNIDKNMRINRYEVKKVIQKLSKTNEKITIKLINGDIFIRFNQ